MPRFEVFARFESYDRYTVEAANEEEAVGLCQKWHYTAEGHQDHPPDRDVTYLRDAQIECVDWDAQPIEG